MPGGGRSGDECMIAGEGATDTKLSKRIDYQTGDASGKDKAGTTAERSRAAEGARERAMPTPKLRAGSNRRLRRILPRQKIAWFRVNSLAT